MSDAQHSLTSADYARAERFLYWNKERYVRNADIQHHWIGSEDRFWYLRTTEGGGREFVLVDAATGRKASAFDHERVASGLARASGAEVDAKALPFSVFRYTPDRTGIQFEIADRLWTCHLHTGACTFETVSAERRSESRSPDGRWAVFLREHNLWARPTTGGREFPLTTDGAEHYGYAGEPGDSRHAVADMRHPKPTLPQVIWSPDSRYVLTYRLDERRVKDMYLIQSVPEDGSIRPRLFPYRYALPGDEHVVQLEPVVLEVATRRQVKLATPPLATFLMSIISARNTWWSADSSAIYYLDIDRFSKSISLNVADPRDGTVTEILRETSKTFLLPADGGLHDNPSSRVLSNGEVIWYSERDGWGHLYRYNAAGELLNRITQGEWVVRGIAQIDESTGRIYFTAGGREAGRDPYYRHLYCVNLDGTGLTLLTPEDAEHQIVTPETPLRSFSDDADIFSAEHEKHSFSPSGRYVVYSYSRPDQPPVLALRSAAGELIAELEKADILALRKGGYTPIESFQVLAADGVTALYGNLYRPSTFDPAKRYPLIDMVYPGPQMICAGKDFSSATYYRVGPAALAELGFLVMMVDGRGTPHRSKAFLDDCYGKMGKAGNIEDHIAAARQLAQRYSYIDLDRVGICGSSGGGYASAHALLAHPEFYKVAVAAAGNHDQRLNYASWGETYNGPVGEGDYEGAANHNFAANLQGKLFLVHGDLDDNVPPAQTLKLADALIKANKDFDLLILPNCGHIVPMSRYFLRRMWDYFVRHLLGAEPPAGYEITS